MEHYDTHNDFIIEREYIIENENECFICLDLVLNDEKPIFLTEQNIYCQTCFCNGSVHSQCLQKWYNRNASCPICRQEMFHPVSIKEAFLDNNPIVIFIYSSRFEHILILTKKLIVASFLFCLFNVILLTLNYDRLIMNDGNHTYHE